MDNWYISIGGQKIPTKPLAGRMRDPDWNDRQTVAITLGRDAAQYLPLFADGASWSLVHEYTQAVPVLDENGDIILNEDGTVKSTTQTVSDDLTDAYRDFVLASPTFTIKMAKKTKAELLKVQLDSAEQTTRTILGMDTYTAIDEGRAQDLRFAIEAASASLDDKTASEAAELFPHLTGDGSLVKSGARINWNGTIKRAASDIWDTPQNTPDAAPTLWEDIAYKQGYRIIPETITAGLAFVKGEKGWWQSELYESLLDANVWTPSVNPDGWKKISGEGT